MFDFIRPARAFPFAALTASAALLIAAAGCQDEGGFEAAGERVDDAVEEVGDAIEDAGDEIEDTLEGQG